MLKAMRKGVFLTFALFFYQPSFATSAYLLHGVAGKVKHNIELNLDQLLKRFPSPLTKKHRKDFARQAQALIKQSMQPYGYYRPTIHVSNHQKFNISPGKPLPVKSIDLVISGPGKNHYHKLSTSKYLSVGKTFNSNQYEALKAELFTIAEEHGYIRSQLKKSLVNVELQCYCAKVSLHFDTGKQFHFGHTTFSSSDYANHFLARYRPYQQGDVFSNTKVLKLNERLVNSGYFKHVSVKPLPPIGRKVPINVALKENPAEHYNASLGYGTNTGPRGRLGWDLIRVTPTGHKFSALLQGSQKESAVQAEYVIPGAQPANEQFSFSAKVFQLDYPVGESKASQLSLAYLSHFKKKQFSLALNVLQEKTEFIERTATTSTLLYPSVQWGHKRLSAPLFSKQGHSLLVSLKGGGLLSGVNFAQAHAQFKWAKMLTKNTRLLMSSELAYTATSSIYSLPLSLQRLAGGSDSLRAYSYQSVGPGKVLLVGGVELQQEVKKDWYLLGLYDIGDVYQPTPRHFRRSVGAGLMYVSPIGPIKLALARALDKQGQPFKVIVSIGPDL